MRNNYRIDGEVCYKDAASKARSDILLRNQRRLKTMQSNKLPRIAITGKLRSGKSVVAGYLSANHGFKELAFGDALKRISHELFEGSTKYKMEPLYRDCPFSDDGKEVIGFRKPRKLYQDVGTALRTIDPDVWIRQVERSMKVWENMRDIHGIVIEDLRQPNEYEWCRANGFVIVRVTAPLEERVRRAEIAGDAFDMASLEHDTESHSDGFEVDFEIVNDGTYEDLERKVDEIISNLNSERER